jgi:hypothetical protein
MEMQDKAIKTTDQGLAAYLMALGHFCITAIPSENPKRKYFVFGAIADYEQKKAEFERGDRVLISPLLLTNKFRSAGLIARTGLGEEEMEKLRGDR